MTVEPLTVRPRLVAHQEGILAVVALLGLGLRDGSPLAGLRPVGPPAAGLAVGAGAGLGVALVLWFLRSLGPIARLEMWQKRLVSSWSRTDAAAIAVASGLAEEALVRALLQPVVGLIPAAAVFAVLHIVPDRGAWAWPVVAFMIGVGLGILFQLYGYPCAAVAHMVLNGAGLYRLAGHPDLR